MEVYDELEKALKEIERLNNIIKEVREYVSRIIIDETYTKCILEILDKVGVDKE